MTNLIKIYKKMKQQVLKKGYTEEIKWVKNLPETPSKGIFFKEYVWVVCNSGMKNQVAKKIFENFWCHGETTFNFDAIKHPHKNKSIKKVFARLDFYYQHYLTSENKLKYLTSLPHIGDITKYHLARNLGANIAKPDRHLKRVAGLFGFSNVQNFCQEIASEISDPIALIDLIIWRFANITTDYIQKIKQWM
jgi:hypothetical protein